MGTKPEWVDNGLQPTYTRDGQFAVVADVNQTVSNDVELRELFANIDLQSLLLLCQCCFQLSATSHTVQT